MMPVDIDAAVTANRRLSADYNVIEFDAAAIAQAARPGQFVMIRTSRGLDPLLRRPFSIFEIRRDRHGVATGISGRVTFDPDNPGAVKGKIIVQASSLHLGNPMQKEHLHSDKWLDVAKYPEITFEVAPFVTLAEALAARGTGGTLFYGARRSEELYCVDVFESLGVAIVLATENGTRGVHGRITVPLEAALRERTLGEPVKLYVCGPTPMMRACAELSFTYGRACDVSLEQVMGCGLGGCYSCVVPARTRDGGPPHHTRTCIDGPVFDAQRVVWENVAAH